MQDGVLTGSQSPRRRKVWPSRFRPELGRGLFLCSYG
jgi:hypothetical protein